MITVISGTNRPDSKTGLIADYIFHQLGKMTEEPVKYFSLESLNGLAINLGMYEEKGQDATLMEFQNEYMLPAGKFVFVFPEYNGGFPGVLKYFLDACSVREYKATFNAKKAALVGVASGRAGNLRGMDHLTGILHHVGTNVMPAKLPISQIENIINGSGKLNEETQKAIEDHLKTFLNF